MQKSSAALKKLQQYQIKYKFMEEFSLLVSKVENSINGQILEAQDTNLELHPLSIRSNCPGVQSIERCVNVTRQSINMQVAHYL